MNDIKYIEYDYEAMDVLLGFKDNFDYNKVIFETKKFYNYKIKKNNKTKFDYNKIINNTKDFYHYK